MFLVEEVRKLVDAAEEAFGFDSLLGQVVTMVFNSLDFVKFQVEVLKVVMVQKMTVVFELELVFVEAPQIKITWGH